MRRLQDYIRFLVWQSGIGYVLLWVVTFWTLDYGQAIFGASGCHPDQAKVLFYWICDSDNPLAMLATLANTALTATVWAPVYIAAATVRPDAISIAAPIVGVHLIGLPAAIFVTIRLMLQFFLIPRRLARRMQHIESESLTAAAGPAAAKPAAPRAPDTAMIEMRLPRTMKPVSPRSEFGLRGPSIR